MGQRYNSTSLQRATFLPMLCSRPSIKNVTIPKSQDPSSSFSLQEDDPLSPKISCIGQVKRHNKIIHFPTTTTTNSNKLAMITTKNHNRYDTASQIPYFKLKRFFSGKSLTTTTTPTAAAIAGRTTATLAKTGNVNSSSSSSSSRSRRRRTRGEELGKNGEETGPKVDERCEKAVVINIVDLDPPLPVIKKKQEGTEKTENLWKRRSGGLELGNLQLQRIRPNLQHQMQPTTV